MQNRCWILAIGLLACSIPNAARSADGEAVERIWLSHATGTPSEIVVNYETAAPEASMVHYGSSPELGLTRTVPGERTRHAVPIPLDGTGPEVCYRVGSENGASEMHRFKTYSSDELRIAIVGDWGFASGRDFSALLEDDPHLLLSAGDNVPNLYQPGKEGAKAFASLIDAHPEIFRRIPFLPVLGNHDREIRPRGDAPPPDPVYDVEATAYREFFTLPGDEWKWQFALPAFDLRLVALDLNHIRDHGTTWQTCHAWQPGSPQFAWYREAIESAHEGFLITLMNERQHTLNGATQGAWQEWFRQGSALVTGFGYFAERAELEEGLPYFNTCLKGTGNLYLDPRSEFHARVDNYLLFTLRADAPKMLAQFKNLQGEVLDTREIEKRPVSR